jgi:hypothetical protein
MLYHSTLGFRFTDDLDIANGKHFSVNGNPILQASGLSLYGNTQWNNSVLTWDTLGGTVVNSSLEGLGTVTSGQLGTDVSPLTAYINGGEIDGVAIGTESASTGKFTSVNVDAVAVIDTSSDTEQALTTNNLTLAEYPFATYRTVKYVGQIQEKVATGTADKIDVFECLVSYKGTGAAVPGAGDLMITTYAYMSSEATPLGTLEVSTSEPNSSTGTDTHIALIWNPATDDMTYSYAVTATQLVKHADMS